MTLYYPVMLRLEGKLCCVVGGGRVAERKAAGLLRAGADVTVISPQVTAELRRLAGEGLLQWIDSPFERGMAEAGKASLLFAATDDPAVNAAVREEGIALGIWVNGADEAEHGDFMLPAVLRQGLLTVAVSTAGASPGMAQLVRDEISDWLGDGYDAYLEVLLELRLAVQQLVSDSRERQSMFRGMLQWNLRPHMKDGERLPGPLFEELMKRLHGEPTADGIRRIGTWLEELGKHDYT
ncbi:bifunctional precorrin-2 dehydrogenase/sirohydrochlorin ferrochelatase [Paenibacillus filicis]|uniref:precorrin-2 dehydrogenase n=1 Tax=Paenibacillus filicis TaxID=669464 RepID=A0ABU9DTB7_9BACL